MTRPELSLVKYLLNKDLYTQYRAYVEVSKEEAELYNVYRLLDTVMEAYNRDISFEEFSLYVQTNTTSKKQTTNAILESIANIELQQDMVETLLVQFKERALAHDIAIKAIEVSEGRVAFSDLQSLITSSQDESQEIKSNVEFVTDDLEELHEQHVKRLGLRWRLKTLNRMLGSLRKGDFGFIFARPETGKTTFLASEVSFFASQLKEDDGPILWFNNEEDGKKVQIRIFQATLGYTLVELFADLRKANEEYRSVINGKIRVIDSAATSKTDVEKACKIHKPSLILFDQIDKIKGFVGDREDLRLGSIYIWGRELAKTYCPVIGVTQADGTAEGKKWLTMENVANAKTAKQAEADWILGIGATHQDGFEYIRHIHASKNKLTGDEDTDPTMRHGKADIIIEPERARYTDYE